MLYLIILSAFATVNCFSSEDIAEETQHAMCKILTREIQATANATITRQLRGVCTTKYIDNKIRQLEDKLLSELHLIKTALKLVPEKPNNFPDSTDKPIDYYYDANEMDPLDYTRTQEIIKFNDTIFLIDNEKVYFYYWKILNINVLLNKNGVYVESPNFTLLGHQLSLQFYPNYNGMKSVALQLRPKTNFLKKHQIIIVHQSDKNKDLNSTLLGGQIYTETIYQLDIYKLSEYINENCLIVKVIIYLNS